MDESNGTIIRKAYDERSLRMSSRTRRISAPLRVIWRSPAWDQRSRPSRSMMTVER